MKTEALSREIDREAPLHSQPATALLVGALDVDLSESGTRGKPQGHVTPLPLSGPATAGPGPLLPHHRRCAPQQKTRRVPGLVGCETRELSDIADKVRLMRFADVRFYRPELTTGVIPDQHITAIPVLCQSRGHPASRFLRDLAENPLDNKPDGCKHSGIPCAPLPQEAIGV